MSSPDGSRGLFQMRPPDPWPTLSPIAVPAPELPPWHEILAALDAETDRLLGPHLRLLYRLQDADLAERLEWVLPRGVLDSLSEFHRVPVRHADVPAPYLGHRVGPGHPADGA